MRHPPMPSLPRWDPTERKKMPSAWGGCKIFGRLFVTQNKTWEGKAVTFGSERQEYWRRLHSTGQSECSGVSRREHRPGKGRNKQTLRKK